MLAKHSSVVKQSVVVPNANPDVVMLVVCEGDETVFAPVVAWRIEDGADVATPITAEDYAASNTSCALHDRRTGLTWQPYASEWSSLDQALVALRAEVAAKVRRLADKAAKR